MNDEWTPVVVDDPAPPEPDSALLASVVSRGRQRLVRRRAIFGAGAAAIAVVFVASGVAVANTKAHGSRVHVVTPTPTTSLSLADRTRRLGHNLFADLPGSYGLTSVDSSTPGVITITGLFGGNASRLVHEAQLASAGTESGLWTAADAARMVRTQARDGMVRSDNGKTTWTYQDGSLQIVARVP